MTMETAHYELYELLRAGFTGLVIGTLLGHIITTTLSKERKMTLSSKELESGSTAINRFKKSCEHCRYFEPAEGDTGTCLYLHEKRRPFWLYHGSPLVLKSQGYECHAWEFNYALLVDHKQEQK